MNPEGDSPRRMAAIGASMVMAAVALLLSIVAICRLYPTAGMLKIDYVGVFGGVLSLMVTVLVGWQIYSIIDFKEQSRRNRLLYERMEEIERKNRESLDKAVAELKREQRLAMDYSMATLLRLQSNKWSVIFVDAVDRLAKRRDSSDVIDDFASQLLSLILTQYEKWSEVQQRGFLDSITLDQLRDAVCLFDQNTRHSHEDHSLRYLKILIGMLHRKEESQNQQPHDEESRNLKGSESSEK